MSRHTFRRFKVRDKFLPVLGIRSIQPFHEILLSRHALVSNADLRPIIPSLSFYRMLQTLGIFATEKCSEKGIFFVKKGKILCVEPYK